MSSEPVLVTSELCKFYNVYDRPADRLKQMFFRGRRRFFTPVEAVKNLSVEIFPGETFGIVGRNGSGKSTFLQLICGTLTPSLGELDVRGKVSALLELGAGFNPEFSGRDNVYLSGVLMGLSEAEIENRFDEIIAFADIGDFVDQPVKNYSSGMFARLAFAVSIHVDAEILVVDEALSVGDEAFQRKCFARINEMKEAGCTILFVSHATGTILEICDRAMLMEDGECVTVGRPRSVVAAYQRLLYAPVAERAKLKREIVAGQDDADDDDEAKLPDNKWGSPTAPVSTSRAAEFDPHLIPMSTTEYGAGGCTISDVRILDGAGRKVNVLAMGGVYQYVYEVRFTAACHMVRFGMMAKLITGIEIGGLVSHPIGRGIQTIESGTTLTVNFGFRCPLNVGTYFLNAGVVGDVNGEEVFLHRILDVMLFRVQHEPENCITGYADISSHPFCTIEES